MKLGSNLWSTDSPGQHLRGCIGIGNGAGWVKSIALASAFGQAWRFRHNRASKVRLWRFGEGQTLRNKLRRIRRRIRRRSSRSMRALRKALDATWCRLRARKKKEEIETIAEDSATVHRVSPGKDGEEEKEVHGSRCVRGWVRGRQANSGRTETRSAVAHKGRWEERQGRRAGDAWPKADLGKWKGVIGVKTGLRKLKRARVWARQSKWKRTRRQEEIRRGNLHAVGGSRGELNPRRKEAPKLSRLLGSFIWTEHRLACVA